MTDEKNNTYSGNKMGFYFNCFGKEVPLMNLKVGDHFFSNLFNWLFFFQQFIYNVSAKIFFTLY